MTILYIDFETYSNIPITFGTYKYMEDVEILLCAYAINDEPVKVWDLVNNKNKVPAALMDALKQNDVNIVAHNSNFDRNAMRFAINANDAMKKAGETISRWHDTMALSLMHSLPGSLARLSEVFKLSIDQAKNKDGSRLIQLFCKPLPANRKLRRATIETHPSEWCSFIEYAQMDVEAMRALYKKMPKWNFIENEYKLWCLDQQINDRGFTVDIELANAAIAATQAYKNQLAKRTQGITDDKVKSTTQRDELLKHITDAFGVTLPDMTKSTLQRRLDDENLPMQVKELLAIRLQASTTGSSKYKTLINAANSDGNLRGTLQFCGASRTGRWAGRKFQPQNLPRPTLKQNEIELGINALKQNCAEIITDDIPRLTNSAVRGCIVAPPDKKLIVADLSNIEGRALAWLAGEKWKVEAFRDFDAGILKQDAYELAYAKAFGVRPQDVTSDQRQIGKTMELACGYQGGVGAYMTFAAAFNIDLEKLASDAHKNISVFILNESKDGLEWAKKNDRPTFGLSDRAWIVCDAFKRMWRYAHPEIVYFWKSIEKTCVNAISNPSRDYQCGKMKIIKDGAWLKIILPSGRSLCYPGARIDDANKLSYMGVSQSTLKWERIKTYGGKIVENITQAFSRDILAYSMPHVEKAGYEIVLTVHDEIISQAPDNAEFNAKHLSKIMSTPPAWAPDIPLAAKGFEDYRYKKD